MNTRRLHIAAGLVGLFCGSWAAAGDVFAAPPDGVESAVTGEVALVWHRDLDTTLSRAEAEYRPVLAVFSSPGCAWCRRLKTETLDDPETRQLLRHFSLVEIDVMDDPLTAQEYGVRGVPTVLILSSDGRVRNGVSGYLSASELCTLLRGELNPEFLVSQDKRYQDLLKTLDSRKVPDDLWPRILIEMGEPPKRKELRDRVFALQPFPAARLVALLEDHRLAVRLGALEILEELAGVSHEFDPWQPGDAAGANAASLQHWNAWAEGVTGEVAQVYAALSAEEIRDCLLDLVSDHRERSLRAMRLLEQGGPGTADSVAAFLSEHPDLSAGARGRIREIQYTLALPEAAGMDVRALAHRLVFGNLDARLKAIQDLPTFRSAAVTVLGEFLQDPDPLIRETAVDSLVKAGSRQVVDLFERHLQIEKDNEVVFAILRALGTLSGKKSLAILAPYLQNANEDLVIAALQSLGKLKTSGAAEQVGPCLEDPRWRVRTAALDAAANMSARGLSDKVIALLDDSDPFVRYTSIRALTELGAKKAAGRLQKLFFDEDDLKGPIVGALLQMELDLPAAFKTALEGRGAEVLLAVIEAVAEDGELKDLQLIAPLTGHADLDVACAAIRPVGSKGMANPAYRQHLAGILREGQEDKVRAVLESISIQEAGTAWQDPSTTFELEALESEGASGAGSKELEELFEAFKPAAEAAAPPPPPPAPSPQRKSDDLRALFEAFGFKTTPPSSSVAPMASGPDPLLDAVRQYADPKYDDRTRFAAALLLTGMGQTDQVAFLRGTLDNRTEDERQRMAYGVRPRLRDEFLPLLEDLMNDHSPAVRTAAAAAAIARGGSRGLERALEVMLRPDSELRPKEIYGYDLESALRRPDGRRVARDFALKSLQQTNSAPKQVLGLLLQHKCWRRTDEAVIRPFLDADDPWVRRAAFYALGQNDTRAFQEVLEDAVTDSSEYVRAVVPQVYMGSSSRWTHYFSKDDFEDDHYYWSARGNAPRLKSGQIEALRKLTQDPAPRVRIESFMALLSNRQTVDLAEVVRAAESVPDRHAVVERIGRYLLNSYTTLGPEFAILLPYVEESENNEEQKEKVRKHFGEEKAGGGRPTELPLLAVQGRRIEATFREPLESGAAVVSSPDVRLVFFTSYGCRDCERVAAMFPQLREVFPGLKIDTHDIRKTRSMSLNEALCTRYGVPDRIRLVTPALFTRAGYSIKDDITFARLGELLSRSAGGDDEWCRVPEEELEQAAVSIGSRYKKLNLGVVGAAGLLDGLNPCAFATIIFLLSYLQVTRRSAREIAQVGLTFIAGVFIAYYAMGLGLVELVSRLGILRRFSYAINGLLGAFTLVIAVLSLRDGFRCLRGRMTEITLQLPGILKRGIHAVIRQGVRHSRFVIAAFVAGLVVSVLELACTGQVYAPTVLFMLKTGGDRLAAMGYLLAYNAAFVVPLFVVFALAMLGLRSETLIRFMKRHAAGVKFATAALFLLLFSFFVWGFRI
ncbi:MAG: HEAT repeat domain-containing protein [Verrucomicrobia bacterium]|nr:HEAT repeat domain-containing protein [Verrucomicrobiota bacterium]